MMRSIGQWFCMMVVAAVVLTAASASAQVIGLFRWQLQPYGNVITVTITAAGTVFRLDGTDDLCGAAKAASAVGTAFINPDGTVGLGFAIVEAPSGDAVHVDAALSLATRSGS